MNGVERRRDWPTGEEARDCRGGKLSRQRRRLLENDVAKITAWAGSSPPAAVHGWRAELRSAISSAASNPACDSNLCSGVGGRTCSQPSLLQSRSRQPEEARTVIEITLRAHKSFGSAAPSTPEPLASAFSTRAEGARVIIKHGERARTGGDRSLAWTPGGHGRTRCAGPGAHQNWGPARSRGVIYCEFTRPSRRTGVETSLFPSGIKTEADVCSPSGWRFGSSQLQAARSPMA